ncbi:alpha/beta hydrolase family protein [Nocardia nova SH22a]|uniref:Alpha/beta hydrolase family protein n=1 Tax=Nocardia nova SH22a TaxID=1415166 RepID=W5TG53_9NOCA|nr:alpha/beta hydrolase [Nocardia nova]AHH18149.1 alpha/beta hydrolase family protein [Nocardia nova SH22a]
MRHVVLAPLTILIAVCAAVLAVAAPATADTTRIPGSVDLPCAATVLHQPADWYLPSGTPRALVWLQHGFARADANVAALAHSLADDGYLAFTPSLPFIDPNGCTLQNLGDNTGFLDQLARLFATSTSDSPLATSLTTAAAQTGHPTPQLPSRLVFIGHSAGAEAVEYVAHRLHTTHPEAWSRLHGLILLDPVKSFLGTNTDTALTDLASTPLPVLTVSGPPGLCNNFGSGTTALQTHLHRPFLGVRLTSGEHTDAEGASTDPLGELLCGIPQPGNVAILTRLTTAWTDAFVDGTATPGDFAHAVPDVVTGIPGVQPLTGE